MLVISFIENSRQEAQSQTRSLSSGRSSDGRTYLDAEHAWFQVSQIRRHNFAPKDKEDLSDKIATWLQDDMGKSHGTVLNREVQPRRGQKTDILVDASANRSGGQERLTIVIEVKGCWNSQIKTALKEQLVEDYLQKNGWSRGIYLVGWFICPRWDHPEKKPENFLDSHPFEEATREVENLARLYNGKTFASLSVEWCWIVDILSIERIIEAIERHKDNETLRPLDH